MTIYEAGRRRLGGNRAIGRIRHARVIDLTDDVTAVDDAPAEPIPGFRETVRADFAAMAKAKKARYPSLTGLIDILMLPGTWAVLIFRTSVALHRAGLRPFSRILYFANSVLFSVDMIPTAVVGPGLALPHPIGVGMGEVRIGRNVTLMGGVRLGTGAFGDLSRDGWPTIGDNCFLMDGAKLFGPVVVGHDTVVATNSVVVRDLPSNVIAMGNPARVVRHRDASPAGEPVDQAEQLRGE